LESKWRWNIPNQGWSDLGMVLAARLLVPIVGRQWVALFDLGGRAGFLFNVQVVDDVMTFTDQVALSGAANPFPFGIPVESDRM